MKVIEFIALVCWVLFLLIFMFYISTNILFYFLSYRNNTHFFAGNQKHIRINPNLQYYIIVPCFNEEDVIYHTLQKLLKFNQFQVVVVDDDSTDRSIEEIKKISNPRCHLVQRFAPNAHTGKGDALNHGLDFIREKITQENIDPNNVIIGVIDADSQLANNALKKLNIHFSIPSTQASQLRVKMYPSFKNELQVLQDIEFFAINHMNQITRMFTHSVGLSGNGQFFRLKPIVQKLGPHPWGNALLDDYELTIKMMLKGIKIDYMPNTYVYQEALPSIKSLIRQRSRWAQGGLNCFKYLKDIIKSKTLSVTQKLSVYYFLATPWLGLLADITVIFLFLDSIYHWNRDAAMYDSPTLLVVIFGLFIFSLIFGLVFVLIYRHNLKYYHEVEPHAHNYVLSTIYISYAYLWLFFSLIIAFSREIFHKDNWLKTQHGKVSHGETE